MKRIEVFFTKPVWYKILIFCFLCFVFAGSATIRNEDCTSSPCRSFENINYFFVETSENHLFSITGPLYQSWVMEHKEYSLTELVRYPFVGFLSLPPFLLVLPGAFRTIDLVRDEQYSGFCRDQKTSDGRPSEDWIRAKNNALNSFWMFYAFMLLNIPYWIAIYLLIGWLLRKAPILGWLLFALLAISMLTTTVFYFMFVPLLSNTGPHDVTRLLINPYIDEMRKVTRCFG